MSCLANRRRDRRIPLSWRETASNRSELLAWRDRCYANKPIVHEPYPGQERIIDRYLHDGDIGQCYGLVQMTHTYMGGPMTNNPTSYSYLGQYLGTRLSSYSYLDRYLDTVDTSLIDSEPTRYHASDRPYPDEPNPTYYFRNSDGTIRTFIRNDNEGFFIQVPCRALDINNKIKTRETSMPTLQSLALNEIPTSEIKYARLLNNNSNVNLTEINKDIASGLGNENLKDSVEATMNRVKKPITNKKCNKSRGCTIMGGKKYIKKSEKNKRKSRKSRKYKS